MGLENFINIKVKDLVKADWNYKENDDELLQKLINNIKENDQIENIIVRELPKGKFEVVNGNHRYDAFVALNMEEAVCYNLGKISVSKAAKIAIETNETKFKSNPDKLSSLLDSIKKDFKVDDLVKTIPFDLENFKKDINNMEWLKPESVKTEVKQDSAAPTTSKTESVSAPQVNKETMPNENRSSVKNTLSENKTLSFKLPAEIAEQFEAQLSRIKKIMYPQENESSVSNTLPIQAIIQVIAETNDKRFK